MDDVPAGCRHGLIGNSPQISSVRRLIGKASSNRLPVLLLGESGTGKEVVARAIHDAKPRGDFVPIDCGSLVGSLMESELFGHVKGSFSGATTEKRGLVELAHGGTAFFDEIGDLPIELQVKLLRLIQEGEFRPVGGLTWRKVDLRVIAATNRDLKADVANRRFREDLFYRLNVLNIHLPPLRERRQDIPLLLDLFLEEARRSYCIPLFRPGDEVTNVLLSYDWPGNVRELKHCVERMVALQSEGVLQMADMPSALQHHIASSGLQRLSVAVDSAGLPSSASLSGVVPLSIAECERHAIIKTLMEVSGNRGTAARILGISRTTLYRRMKAYLIA